VWDTWGIHDFDALEESIFSHHQQAWRLVPLQLFRLWNPTAGAAPK
jgi:hypothetical protein